MSETGDLTTIVEIIIPFDVTGDDRVLVYPTQTPGGIIDRGADEYSPEEPFKRGDANDDAATDLSDAIFVLTYLFNSGPAPSCRDTADCNDDGFLNLADPIYLLTYLLLQGPPLAYPFPNCGEDPTQDLLRTCSFQHCP